VSGHACQEEQKLLLALVRPKFFVPIHGELRMLNAHAKLAREIGMTNENVFVVENGTPIVFDDGEAKVQERMPGGYVFVDGSGVGDITPSVIRDREALARDGIITVLIRRNSKGGLIDTEIHTRGFVLMKDADEMDEALSDVVNSALEKIESMSEEDIKKKTTEALSKRIYSESKRRPMIIPIVA
jgi:ribonuclease J